MTTAHTAHEKADAKADHAPVHAADDKTELALRVLAVTTRDLPNDAEVRAVALKVLKDALEAK